MPFFIATSPKGFEYLLVDELIALGATSAHEGLTQVSFESSWETLYSICLWTRLANRILYPIETFECEDNTVLYEKVKTIEWDCHFSAEDSFAVDFVSRKSNIQHQQFGAQRIKDAIVDYFRETYQARPQVDLNEPSVRLHCRINKNQATLCIDLSGTSLHQRGYRHSAKQAPLKESLAAAILYRAQWPQKATEGQWLLDPFCGSGTIAIEAALMANHIAPGLTRHYWGFNGWKPFHQPLWQKALESAQAKKASALANAQVHIYASDIHPQQVKDAQHFANQADVTSFIEWQVSDFKQRQTPANHSQGVIVTNPPYGQRLESDETVTRIYSDLGQWLKTQYTGCHAAILSSQKSHGHALNIRAQKIYRFRNGTIDCELLCLDLKEQHFVDSSKTISHKAWNEDLNDNAIMLMNRLKKNQQGLKSYLSQHHISCYRLYDADLPEYAAAIDVYDDHCHIQEYAPPKSVDKHKALRRLRDIERIASGVLNIPKEHIHVKTRLQQKGSQQYEKYDQQQQRFIVQEDQAKFYINLTDYLDTGLFLDHRKTRQLLQNWSENKQLLNLFSYTGTASVQAALKGAITTSVDLSNTYLEWMLDNFALNNIDTDHHTAIRDNVMDWLLDARHDYQHHFDVIFIDPPTFSNSKKMQQDFDIQKDHIDLIERAIALLKPTGKLIFSTNFKKFKFEYQPQGSILCKDITKLTTPRDFIKKPLHKAWLIEKS